MRTGKRVVCGTLGIIMLIFFSFSAQADGNGRIFNSVITEDTAYIYTSAPDNFNSVSCQIGTEEAQEIRSQKVSDISNSMETYLLVDNSLSIKEEYRDKVKEIAQAVISGRVENESITLATFDTELHVLADKSTDINALAEIVRQIEYKNLDTKLTDVLYQLYQSFESGAFHGVRRVIVISDGAEYQKVGYTQEEVLSKVKKYHYPIYTVGCRYKDNDTELENMFRFSRDSDGAYWLIDEIQDMSSLTGKMDEMKNAVMVEAKIPESMGDGSEKGIKLTFHTGSGDEVVSLKETMPFMVAKETEQITETETVPETQTEETEELTIAETETETEIQEEKHESGILPVAAIAVVIVVAGAIVAIIIFKKKKTSDGDENPGDILSDLFDQTRDIKNQGGTVLLDEKEGATEILYDDQPGAEIQYHIRLTDIHNASSIQEFWLKENESKSIGRKWGAVDIAYEDERTVSSRHCELSTRDGNVYIKDLRSSNGTVVDGERIEDDTILYSGSILKLGNLQLKFELL